MSYEAYPPPISSSPPPLDAMPSPMDEEDEEEEFGLRTGLGSPVFDITGLSEKLPPTPKGSPVKSVSSLSPDHLPSKASSCLQPEHSNLPPDVSDVSCAALPSDNNEEDFEEFGDFTVGACGDVLENRSDFSNENNEKLSCREERLSSNDFGEFTNFQTGVDSLPASDLQSSSVTDEKHLPLNESNTSCPVVPIKNSAAEPCDLPVINSKNDFSCIDNMSENVSSLTCSADSNESISVEKQEPHIPSPILVKDEHGQLVPKEPFVIDKEDDVFHYFEAPASISFNLPESSKHLDVTSELESISDTVLPEDDSNLSQKIKNPSSIAENEDASLDLSANHLNQSRQIDTPSLNTVDNVAAYSGGSKSDTLNCLPNDVSEQAGELDSQPHTPSHNAFSDDFEAFADFQSFSSIEEPFKARFDCNSSGDVNTPTVGALVDEVVISCSLPTIEGMTDSSPDDDFGYRNIDVEDDSQEHNDQDFPAIEAKNDLIIHNAISEIVTEADDDDEFDDFVVSTGVADDPSPEEFDEFASAKIADAFGEFGVENASNTLDRDREAKVISEDDDDDDDGFGEFTDFSVAAANAEESSMDVSGSTVPALSRSVSIDSRPDLDTINDPLLSKLDGLVRKWITAPPEQSLISSPPDLLRDVVKGDAFVWRKLESVEWESVVWQSTAAHSLLLSALNMDARNILYSQKWSSSVPLFAQSLSFSPLTPAKPTSGSSFNSHTQNGTSSDFWQPPAQLPTNANNVTPPVVQSASSNSGNSTVASEAPNIDVSSLDSLHPSTNKGASSSSNLDWLSYESTEEHDVSHSSGASSSQSTGPGEPSMPAAVQRLLATSTTTTSRMTSLDQLTDKERQFLKSLPDLSFMTAKVLMFPITGGKD